MSLQHSAMDKPEWEPGRPMDTSNSMEPVLLLYEGCIGFLDKAKEFAEKGDVKNKNIFANKANEIILELHRAVDVEAGGQIGENLKKLYAFMYRHLMKAVTNGSNQELDDVKDMMSNLKDGWQHVSASVRDKN